MSEFTHLLSIIIPTYNSAKYISRMLELLIAQKLDDCELIIVDDGSSDDTINIVRDYERKIENIIIVEKEHTGVSVSRNIGAKLAKGEYIYFLDSDDMLEEGTLSFYKDCIRDNSSIDILAFAYKKINLASKRQMQKYENRKYNKKQLDNQELKKIFFGKKLNLHICSFLILNRFLKEKQLQFTPGIRIAEDVEFIVKTIFVCRSLKYFNRYCYIYLCRPDSSLASARVYNKERLSGFIRRIDFLTNNNNEDNPYINFFIAYSYVANLYNCIKEQGLTIEDEVYDIFKHYDSTIKKNIKGNLKYYIMIKILSLFSFEFLVLILNRFYSKQKGIRG